MTVLAIDLGTHLGYALDADPVVYGTVTLTPSRFESAGFVFLRFRKWLDNIHDLTPITFVAYEEVYRHAGTAAAHRFGGLLALLQTWCVERGIEHAGIGVSVNKKHATGKGNADKAAMIAAAVALGYEPADDNAADAIHLLRYAKEKMLS